MGTRTKTSDRLNGPRQRLALRKLANQIRTENLAYKAFSDQKAIDTFIELEMRSYRLDLAFHETAVLLGEETHEDRPTIPSLLWQALEYESRTTPRVAYAAQLLFETMENTDLKKELMQAEAEVKRLKAMIEQLVPWNSLRLN